MIKMNKKGFTLIEMLVVIAIIAILVAIIIPVVGNSTAKAAGATDAANLRSAKASLTIGVLNGDIAYGSSGTAVPAGYGDTPEAKTKDAGAFGYSVDADGVVTTYFGTADKNINYFAGIAATGKAGTSGGQQGGEQGGQQGGQQGGEQGGQQGGQQGGESTTCTCTVGGNYMSGYYCRDCKHNHKTGSTCGAPLN